MADNPKRLSISRSAASHAGSKHTRIEKHADKGQKTEVTDGGASSNTRKSWRWVSAHKWSSIAAAGIVLIAVVFVIPVTRYSLLGLFWKKNFSVTVLDSQTSKPISNATVTLDGSTAVTSGEGTARLHVKVGHGVLTVSKKYYKDNSAKVLIPLSGQRPQRISLVATGRQVLVTVVNKINGSPVSNATISSQGTQAKTDAKGQAAIVLPASKSSVSGQISGSGYNNTTVTITVTATVVPSNTFRVAPSGRLYFLSNLGGNIDVVGTNLDGSGRQTILAGTGKEDPADTVLLATRDWKYLVLLSKRDGGDNPKLFLINTATDSLSTIDEGDADFNPVGWDGHDFLYTVTRHGVQNWQANAQALKSYNADTNALETVDQTGGSGTNQYDYMRELFGQVYILAGKVVYTKGWEAGYNAESQLGAKQATLLVAKPDGSSRAVVQSFTPVGGSYGWSVTLNTRPYEASGLYIEFPGDPNNTFYTYEDGVVTPDTSLTNATFWNNPYSTYLLSPSGKQTFWAEPRDGKNTLFIGDPDGHNGKQIATLSDYSVYGWYTDNYLLVSKDGSELYLMPVGGGSALKVTDYYKPALSFSGYGSGYGGL